MKSITSLIASIFLFISMLGSHAEAYWIYDYLQKDDCRVETLNFDANNDGTINRAATLTYDNGNLIRLDWEGDLAGEDDESEHYFYRDDGKMDKVEFRDGDGKLEEVKEFIYDATGRIVRSDIYFYRNGERSLDETIEFEYDNGRPIRKTRIYRGEVDEIAYYLYEGTNINRLEYDIDGNNVIDDIDYLIYDDGKLVRLETDEDDNGVINSKLHFIWNCDPSPGDPHGKDVPVYDVLDYFPFTSGSYWIYEISEGPEGSDPELELTAKGEIDGQETINGVEAVKLYWSYSDYDNMTQPLEYSLYSYDKDYIYFHGEKDVFDHEEGYILSPPVKNFSRSIRIGESISTNFIKIYPDGRETWGNATVTLMAIEDVTVPYGKFDNCLKFYKDKDGSTSYNWLAKGVGTVKTKSVDHNNDWEKEVLTDYYISGGPFEGGNGTEDPDDESSSSSNGCFVMTLKPGK